MVLFRRTYVSLAAAIMLPIVAFLAVQVFYLLRDDRRAVEQAMLDRAEQITTHLDTVIAADISALRVLGTAHFFGAADWAGLYARVLAVVDATDHWHAAVLWDFAEDRVIFDTRVPYGTAPEGPPPRQRWALPAGEPKLPWIGGIVQVDGRPFISLHVPVLRGGAITHVLTLALAPQFYQAAMLQRLPPRSVAAVVDRRGLFIARSLRYEETVGTPATSYVRDAIAAGPSGIYPGVTFEGFKNYTAYWTSPTSGWSTHIAIAAGLIDQPWSRSILVVGLGGFAAVALAGLLMFLSLRDLADRRRAEEQLRQSQKMEAIGQLTGGVAHDFNNLLTVMLGSLERLRRKLGEPSVEPEELIRHVDNARQGAERAAALTRSLLAFSRQQALEPRPVDVNRLVVRMSEVLERTLGETVAVEVVRAAGLWRAQIDPNQLEIAIINLAVNARDAMPEGGKLTIETANAYLDEKYAAANAEAAPGQYVALSVTDTGTGMTPEIMARVFEPFFTTKPLGRGTGLGLAQVYGFVKQSGGHVKIYSEPDEGTTVRLYLPRVMAEAVGDEVATEPAPPARAGRKLAILVVEDDAAVRAHTTGLLREIGHAVEEAPEAATALALLDRRPDIELLFTDVGLPGGMNGRQLADEALRRHPGLKVLYTTGYAKNAIVHGGRLDPGLALLAKPFTRAELETRLAEVAETLDRPPCLLLVEDEPMIAIDTAETLKELGYEVETAATGTDALNALRRRGARIDGAIVDFGLPDMKGDALVRELRAMNVRLPILVASGSDPGELRRRIGDTVAIGFVSKPYGSDELKKALAGLGFPVGSRAA
ncbi:response regulator [Desertibaculum subflavum]|uniref:response regulator n=1 Tax=Desertibaculum subflavum TaxID=2268458 RepID=UPI000E65EC85